VSSVMRVLEFCEMHGSGISRIQDRKQRNVQLVYAVVRIKRAFGVELGMPMKTRSSCPPSCVFGIL
jgi:DNA-binding LytR/AlgR family response regulator